MITLLITPQDRRLYRLLLTIRYMECVRVKRYESAKIISNLMKKFNDNR